MKQNLLVVLILTLFSTSCEYEFPDAYDNYSSGTADFSLYVNIGGIQASGFMDGALYNQGQSHSYAALLAAQMSLAGGTAFNQPVIQSENGYNLVDPGTLPNGRYVNYFYSSSQAQPIIQTLQGEAVSDFTGDRTLIHDFSVPGMRIYQIDDPALSANPYYSRFASDPGNSTLLDDILRRDPTFFTLVLGFDDIVQYATSGGSGNPDPLPDPSQIQNNDLTPEDLFESRFNDLLSSLLQNPGTTGVVANIPSPSHIPYFYYYPYNFLKLSNSRLGQAIFRITPFNNAVAINNAIPDNNTRPYISWDDNGIGIPSPQRPVVADTSLGDAQYPDGNPLEKIRQINSNELILYNLPYGEVSTGLGWLNPIPEECYLSYFEIIAFQSRINAFNRIIKSAVDAHPGRLALVDLSTFYFNYSKPSILDGFGTPKSYDLYLFEGVPVEFNMQLNGVFSLDALYLNQRGQALLANEFIKAINSTFGANLPLLDINKYPGNKYVFDFK